jgi:hypothetical protein
MGPIAGAILVLLAALQYWLWYFHRATNLLDEGSTAAQALRILQGDLIYRDFFTVVTPLSYYTVAWLFDLFGAHLMVLRWAALVTGLGIALATYAIGLRVMAWPFAAAAALMTTVWGWFLVTPNFYSLQAALFALVALAYYLRHVDGGGAKWLVSAGVMAGLTVLVKQNVGAYLVAALFAAEKGSGLFFTNRPQPAGVRSRHPLMMLWRFVGNWSRPLSIGVAVPVAVGVVMLVAAGAGPYLYESWVYYPLAKYPQRFALPYPDFYPVLAEHGVATLRDALAALATRRVAEPAVFEIWVKFVIYLPVLVYPLACVALGALAWRARREGAAGAARDAQALLAIVLTGLMLLLQAWPRADVAHILFGLQPTFILFAYLLSRGWLALAAVPGPRLAVRGVAMVLMLAPLGLFLWNGYRRTDWEYANYVAHLRADRATGVRTLPIEAQRIDLVTRYILEHTTPDDPIFVVPWASGFYFLTDRRNPTRIDFMLFEDAEAYPCLLAQLDQRPPKYVIYGYTWDVDGRRFREYAAPVDAYIRSRYAIADHVDGYEIWRRLDGLPPRAEAFRGACAPKRFRWRDVTAASVP